MVLIQMFCFCSSPYNYSGGRLPDSSAEARLNAFSSGLRKASLSVENQQTASFVRSKQVSKSDYLVRSASAAVVESTSPSAPNPVCYSLSVDFPSACGAADTENTFQHNFQVGLTYFAEILETHLLGL